MHDVPVAILAGGLATRLRPITETIPKALVEVAGEPFLAHQLRQLRSQGLRQIVLCVGYLGGMIQDVFGDGAAFDVHIDYSFDGPTLLGTGGALARARDLLGPAWLTLYGDSYLRVNFHDVWKTFLQSGKPALMSIFNNEDQWDRSNVRFEDGSLLKYDKQACGREFRYIDYGLNVFRRELFDGRLLDQPFDLAEIQTHLVDEGNMAAYIASERFFEIGSKNGLAELEQFLTNKAL